MFNYNEIGQAKAPISGIEIASLPMLSKAD
jgi:hypothetical protein